MRLPSLLRRLFLFLSGLALLAYLTPAANADGPKDAEVVQEFFSNGSGHTNNWAVLVTTPCALFTKLLLCQFAQSFSIFF